MENRFNHIKPHTSSDIESIRIKYKNTPQRSLDNSREAYISKSYESRLIYSLSVNYWTDKEVAIGERAGFGSQFEIIEKLKS